MRRVERTTSRPRPEPRYKIDARSAGWTSPTSTFANGVLAPNSAAEVNASKAPRFTGSVLREGVCTAVGPERAGAGWGARIRTWVWRNQNPLPYHLATPQSLAEAGHHNDCRSGGQSPGSERLRRCDAEAISCRFGGV